MVKAIYLTPNLFLHGLTICRSCLGLNMEMEHREIQLQERMNPFLSTLLGRQVYKEAFYHLSLLNYLNYRAIPNPHLQNIFVGYVTENNHSLPTGIVFL